MQVHVPLADKPHVGGMCVGCMYGALGAHGGKMYPGDLLLGLLMALGLTAHALLPLQWAYSVV
jgi:hypothetical protein